MNNGLRTKHYELRTILLLLILPMCIQAQGDLEGKKTIGASDDARFRLSLLAGMNASQIDGDEVAGFNKPGLNIGGQVNILLDRKDWVGRFQPSVGISFSQLGSSAAGNDNPALRLQRFKLDYAQIPVMIHYVDQRWVFSAGFAYGRLVNTTFIDSFGDDISDVQSPSYRESGVTFIGGGTVYINRHIGLNINWERSIYTIHKNLWQVHRSLSFRGVYTF